MDTRLDHLVIAASTLEQGADYIREQLGVEIPDGGRHELMGTHNKVMSLGNGVYLEVIAVNPNMSPPVSPRWFGLDDPHILNSISRRPRLLTWAVNTSNLEYLVQESAVSIGDIRHAERDNLKWKVAITEDGRLPGAGFIPLCIQWLVDFHPSENMQQLGCKFESLALFHPRPQWLRSSLVSIEADSAVIIAESAPGEYAHLELTVNTPGGSVLISSKVNQ
jgi:hypothetical protein